MVFVIVLPAKPKSKPLGMPGAVSEYDHIKHQLQLLTGGLVLLITLPVTWLYGLNTGLSFLVGGLGGLVYLRLLSRSIDRLGTGQDRLSNIRLGIFIGVILVATRWQTLQIIPTFLGFLTYKLAVLGWLIRDLTGANSRKEGK